MAGPTFPPPLRELDDIQLFRHIQLIELRAEGFDRQPYFHAEREDGGHGGDGDGRGMAGEPVHRDPYRRHEHDAGGNQSPAEHKKVPASPNTTSTRDRHAPGPLLQTDGP